MLGNAFLMMGAAALGHVIALSVALGLRQRLKARTPLAPPRAQG